MLCSTNLTCRRRGLSAFYSSKSQSFNCMRDLQNNPFCQSTCLLLAKQPPPTQLGPFSSIQEELCCDLIEQQPAGSLSTHPDGSMSEPGSPQPRHGLLSRHSWPGSSSPELQDHEEAVAVAAVPFAPPLPSSWHGYIMAPQHSAAPQLVLHPSSASVDSRCGSPWLGPALSSSSDGSMGSMDACDASFEGMADAYCCLQQQQHQEQPPTDSLCEALKAATLTARRTAHQAAAMLPLAATCGLTYM